MTIDDLIVIDPECLQFAQEILGAKVTVQTPDGEMQMPLYAAKPPDVAIVRDQICSSDAATIRAHVYEILKQNVLLSRRSAKVAAALLTLDREVRTHNERVAQLIGMVQGLESRLLRESSPSSTPQVPQPHAFREVPAEPQVATTEANGDSSMNS